MWFIQNTKIIRIKNFHRKCAVMRKCTFNTEIVQHKAFLLILRNLETKNLQFYSPELKWSVLFLGFLWYILDVWLIIILLFDMLLFPYFLLPTESTDFCPRVNCFLFWCLFFVDQSSKMSMLLKGKHLIHSSFIKAKVFNYDPKHMLLLVSLTEATQTW